MNLGAKKSIDLQLMYISGGLVALAQFSGKYFFRSLAHLDGPEARHALAGKILYEPFAGSGTTLVEALKLGATVIARDINPIATLTQRQAVQPWDMAVLESYFKDVETACRDDIEGLYIADSGEPVLHYFWVAVAYCPEPGCGLDVELFSNYIFAKHAYPSRHPLAQATCPSCHAVCPTILGRDLKGKCAACGNRFAFNGPVKGRNMICRNGHQSGIIDALQGEAPQRKMYAKVVLTAEGTKEYRPIDKFDRDLYEIAVVRLAGAGNSVVFPEGQLEQGESTIQALRWGYQTWASFFNDRQLYSLGRIAAALRDLPGLGPEREALAAAFSKTVEHHNVFCSFKGEGTGPVRSIFHNHVLRPERCSVEGNSWGGHGGSGGFAEALIRLQRAQASKIDPQDLTVQADGSIIRCTNLSTPHVAPIVESWTDLVGTPGTAYIRTGDAAQTDLPKGSVDLIVTDPPYVDNVHYSELADFFHTWMRAVHPHATYPRALSTRSSGEVQNADVIDFQETVRVVWMECARVLRDDGILVFSFHQSKTSGWAALMASLFEADFVVTAIRPVVAEVSTSLSKVGAAAPNRIDVIVVCRKKGHTLRHETISESVNSVVQALTDLQDAGLQMGSADIRTAVRATILARGTGHKKPNWNRLSELADVESESALLSFS